jgi:hypothetical protein
MLRLTAHHAVCDGWSLGIMMAEISSLYTANLTGDHSRQTAGTSSVQRLCLGHLRLRTQCRTCHGGGVLGRSVQRAGGTTGPPDRPYPSTQKTYAGNRLDLDMEPQLVPT